MQQLLHVPAATLGVKHWRFSQTCGNIGLIGTWSRTIPLSMPAIVASQDLLARLFRAGLHPDAVTFNAAIGACERAQRWSEALSLLSSMLRQGVPQSVVTYNAVMAACANGKQWERALSLFRAMPEASSASFAVAIAACGRGSSWQEACWLLDATHWAATGGGDLRLVVGNQHFNAAAGACAAGGQWQRALWLLFQELPSRTGLAPDAFSFSAAIGACEDATVATRECVTQQQLNNNNNNNNSYPTTTTTAVSVDGSGLPVSTHWLQALALLHAALERDVSVKVRQTGQGHGGTRCANIAVFNATISALEKAHLWERALQVFDDVPAHGLKPDEVTYGSTILALHAGGQQEAARLVYSEAVDCSLISPVVRRVSRNAGVPGEFRRDARELHHELVLDLHNLPVVVAELAVEAALDELIALSQPVVHAGSQDEEVSSSLSLSSTVAIDATESLSIITGRGNHSPGGEAVMREAVLEMLDKLGPRLGLEAHVDPNNPGLICCRAVRRDLMAQRTLGMSGMSTGSGFTVKTAGLTTQPQNYAALSEAVQSACMQDKAFVCKLVGSSAARFHLCAEGLS
ncbi:unnamed protein product [Polarella glacialis]|uniref:Smr domain-containing protein n=1 Tax=Polarella glacialis TaxID=89957 RepID=A0A813EK27_POLGL|nr:unnamed protein product [Polarella glacialis]